MIRGRLPAEEATLLLLSLEAARGELRRGKAAEEANVSAETQKADASLEAAIGPEEAEGERTDRGRGNADALVLVAEAALASGEAGRTGGDRHQLVLHADAATLGDEGEAGRCELEDGTALCAETARRIACDASVVAIAELDGRPLSVGRKTRTIPPALRRALRSRDRCCRFPGCTQRRFVDAHHIHHWAHGGETKLTNLVLLCRHHHRLLHEGGFRMERLAGGRLRFRRPDGRPIRAIPGRTRGDHREIHNRNLRAGLRIGPYHATALSGGGRFSLDLAVDGLLALQGRADLVTGSPPLLAVSAETPATGLSPAPQALEMLGRPALE